MLSHHNRSRPEASSQEGRGGPARARSQCVKKSMACEEEQIGDGPLAVSPGGGSRARTFQGNLAWDLRVSCSYLKRLWASSALKRIITGSQDTGRGKLAFLRGTILSPLRPGSGFPDSPVPGWGFELLYDLEQRRREGGGHVSLASSPRRSVKFLKSGSGRRSDLPRFSGYRTWAWKNHYL